MLTLWRRKLRWGLPILMFFFLGCSSNGEVKSALPLLSCRGLVITVGDYRDAVSLAVQGYTWTRLSTKEGVTAVRRSVFNQLQEELVLLALGRDRGITLGEGELDAGVQSARDGYPPGAFEEALVTRGLSFSLWKERLARRLLMEKILKSEFGGVTALRYEDFQAVPEDLKAELSEEGLVRQVRRSGMEARYRDWRQQGDVKYSIDVNRKLWEKILKEDRP